MPTPICPLVTDDDRETLRGMLRASPHEPSVSEHALRTLANYREVVTRRLEQRIADLEQDLRRLTIARDILSKEVLRLQPKTDHAIQPGS